MSAGKDEASSGFLLDAPNSLNTNFYLLVGANAYGYTNLASSSTATGDVDTYALLLNVGYSYTVISTSQVLYSPGVETMAFVLSRYGALTTIPIKNGDYYYTTFIATDSLYYIQTISPSVGFYGLRVVNNSIAENNGVGETLNFNVFAQAALDYTSDADHFFFNGVKGKSYAIQVVSTIPDIFIKVSSATTNADIAYSTTASSYYTFTTYNSDVYDIVVSANGFTSTGSYAIKLMQLNSPPVASNATLTTKEDIPINGTLTATDTDANLLSYSKVTGPFNGNVVVNLDGSYTYTPASNYNGSDSFTFKVNDGTVDSAVATVSITVTAINDAPLATATSTSTNEDTVKTGALAGTDIDGNSLTYAKVSDPSHGTVTINSQTGAYTYTPALNYSGTDSFTFKVNDGTVDSSAATVSITVTPITDITGQVYHWKNHSLLQGVQIVDGTASATTGSNGSYHLDAINSTSDLLVPTLSTQNAGAAVDSADALAALKLAVGLNPNANGAAVSPYQFIAADVNEDGEVNSADALAILKMSVNRPDAPASKWIFVKESEDFWNESVNSFTTTRKNVTFDKSIDVNTQSDVNVNVVAVLKGDVNGNWAAGVSVPTLDTLNPNYFAELSSRLGCPQSQWVLAV